MSDLLARQQEFSKSFGQLLQWLYSNGYSCTIGEVLRTEKQAEQNAVIHVGIKNSLHLLKLAADIAIFEEGRLLSTFDEHLPIGEYWESLGGSWGGRFTKQDCDHFSLSYNGVR